MNTDEMILALVDRHGFTLPIHYAGNKHAIHRWFIDERVSFEDGQNLAMLTDQQAHDLCAMHFAREAIQGDKWADDLIDNHEKLVERWDACMSEGDSDGAIQALYEAMDVSNG